MNGFERMPAGAEASLRSASEAAPSLASNAAVMTMSGAHELQGNPLIERAFMAERLRFGYVTG